MSELLVSSPLKLSAEALEQEMLDRVERIISSKVILDYSGAVVLPEGC